MLATVLKELHQLADGFTHCYEMQISEWCHQTPPELSELGVVFKKVHTVLQKFVKVIYSRVYTVNNNVMYML